MYVVGPLAGALIAVGCAYVLRGRGGGEAGYAAGSGRLDKDEWSKRERLSRQAERDVATSPAITDTDTRRSGS